MNSGITKHGQYSNNSMVKVHRKDMSFKEASLLCELYNYEPVCEMSLDDMFGKHLYEKLQNELHINSRDFIYEGINPSYIIEFNTGSNGKDSRILIRFKDVHKVNMRGIIKECNLCVVYSLRYSKYITAYWNEANDNHETLREEQYTKNFNIIEHLRRTGVM